MISKPKERETPFYFSYYISLPTEENLIKALENVTEKVVEQYKEFSENQGSFKYQEDKWTIKQLLNHLIDTERILSTRALHFARKDKSVLPGFDENAFAENDDSESQTIEQLLEEYKAVRKSTELLFKNINQKNLDNKGNANGAVISVRELGWTIAGHDLHHLKILKERYLGAI